MRWLLLLLVCFVCAPAHASTTSTVTVVPAQSYEVRKRSAFQLVAGKDLAAAGALQKLLAENNNDTDILFALGQLESKRAQVLKPGAKRQKALKEARKYFVRAKEAGSTEPLITTILAEINVDGSENPVVFSADAKINEKIHAAERAYEQQAYAKAIALYQEVLAIDPKHYKATLYLGDAYFASGQNAPAITWFAKATDLDPNRETAYRYQADALMRLGKKDLALEQYVQAVVAEPNNGYPWRALQSGCTALLLKPWTAAAKVPVVKVGPDEKGNVKISLAENFTVLDVAYAGARAKWQTEHPASPDGKKIPYRQTIEEETDALKTLLKIWQELKASGKKPTEGRQDVGPDLELSMAQLQEIEAAGLLEPHIFLFRTNQDIATDYTAYREKHRDRMHDYLVRFYLRLQ